ncbi:DUF2804 domain-containing protein [Ornithinibacillus halophilus]|uniref:DUF2804 domain-containing protein n=1 Tax=Ornithinibacillus halophilus TaxID=930117 RepID=A0A1M5EVX9_9BACI|nr:DUF2804 domain-containing protein [Ornithinibacillus halophilus]SHF83368.1 Protein of unknown function [Ornithinibacillus halophilus]
MIYLYPFREVFIIAKYHENEIIKPIKLCTTDGKFNKESIGWARRPIITSNLSGNFLRKKKWNYWCVFGKDALFSATITHMDYAAVCFIYYLEYSTKKYIEETVLVPFHQKLTMPEEVLDSVEFIHNKMGIFFVNNGNNTLLKVSSKDFGGKTLEVNLTINHPNNADSLNVVVPWSDEQFQFTAKHHCLPATGKVKVGDQSFSFDEKSAFAVLDYGRGVWPRKSTWNWGMASGKQHEDVIGLNFGGQWTDNTGSNENAFFVNGSITKINEDVEFIYDRNDFMKPWKIESTETDDVRLTFHPFFERKAASNAVVVKSDVHQMVGHYEGYVRMQNGEKVEINQLLGCIEEHIAVW